MDDFNDLLRVQGEVVEVVGGGEEELKKDRIVEKKDERMRIIDEKDEKNIEDFIERNGVENIE